MLRVRAWMAGLGLDVDVRDAPLRLVDVPPPARDASEVREPARTLTQELRRTDPFGRTTVTRSITGVEVVRGLTRVHYGSLVAHELTHAWVFLADVGLPSGPVEEGVAELVRWYWLRSRDEAEAAYWAEAMEQNRDPVYGEGFRWVRARYRGEPLAGFIRSLGASAGGVSPSG